MATILVIDDERMLCDLLQEMLRRHGHEVFTAYSGQAGLQAFHQHRPQFTLLDLHLPDMSGIEVLHRIRERNSKAAVMILTGAASDKLERQARDLGITDYLIKGLSPDVLIGAVERALQPAAGPGGRTPRPAHGESILVVDDERQICELLKKYLEQQGYRVHTAQDGLSALALTELKHPQMIVLDINMPGMNGVEVLRRLRANHFPGVVMMLTGSQDETLLKEALDMGAVDIVGKPADLERIELAIQVSLIMARKPGAKAAG